MGEQVSASNISETEMIRIDSELYQLNVDVSKVQSFVVHKDNTDSLCDQHSLDIRRQQSAADMENSRADSRDIDQSLLQ